MDVRFVVMDNRDNPFEIFCFILVADLQFLLLKILQMLEMFISAPAETLYVSLRQNKAN